MTTLECWSASSVSLLELGYSRLWNGRMEDWEWEHGRWGMGVWKNDNTKHRKTILVIKHKQLEIYEHDMNEWKYGNAHMTEWNRNSYNVPNGLSCSSMLSIHKH